MTVNDQVSHQIDARLGEQQSLIDELREQVRALEKERDRALQGLQLVTEASRRRGCCDSHD